MAATFTNAKFHIFTFVRHIRGPVCVSHIFISHWLLFPDLQFDGTSGCLQSTAHIILGWSDERWELHPPLPSSFLSCKTLRSNKIYCRWSRHVSRRFPSTPYLLRSGRKVLLKTEQKSRPVELDEGQDKQ